MAQAPIQMPNYMGAAQVKMAQRAQAVGEMDRIIQQYKLDAENERRVAGGALATLGAEMENNPDGVNSLAQSNPEFGKALKLLNEGKAKKKDMQIISASLAANTQARAQKLQEDNVNARNIALDLGNKFNKATFQNRVLATSLENDAIELMNNIRRNQETITGAQADYASETETHRHELLKTQVALEKQKLEENRKRWESYPPDVRARLEKQYDELKVELARLSGQPAARTFEDANKDMEVVRSSAISVDGEGSTFGALIDANPPGSDFWENERIPTQTRTLYNRYLGLLMERDQLGRQPIVIGGVGMTPEQLAEAKQAQDDYGAAFNALSESAQTKWLKGGGKPTADGMSMQELRLRLADLNELLEREKAEAKAEATPLYEEQQREAPRQLFGPGSSGLWTGGVAPETVHEEPQGGGG